MAQMVRAQAKHIDVSPLKVRRVIAPLRGMQAVRALDLVRALPHSAASPVAKVLASALANADDQGLDVESMYISQFTADEGPGVMPEYCNC